MTYPYFKKFFSRIFHLKFWTSYNLCVPLRMRLLILLLLTTSLYGQRLTKTPYEARMDSLALANLNLRILPFEAKESFFTLLQNQYVKVTLLTNINGVNFQTVIDRGESEAITMMGKYDVRAKFYLNDRWRFVIREVNSSFIIKGQKGYTSLIGLICKF